MIMFHPLRSHLDPHHDRWQIQFILCEFDGGNRNWLRIVQAVYRRLRVKLFPAEVLEVLIRHRRIEVMKGRGIVYLRGREDVSNIRERTGSQRDSAEKKQKRSEEVSEDVWHEKYRGNREPIGAGDTSKPRVDVTLNQGWKSERELDEGVGKARLRGNDTKAQTEETRKQSYGEAGGAVAGEVRNNEEVADPQTEYMNGKSSSEVKEAAQGDVGDDGARSVTEEEQAARTAMESWLAEGGA